MKHKEKIFEILRKCVETPQEKLAVEEMINKVEKKMLPLETVSDTKKIFNGFSFYKNKKGRYSCTISLPRFLWQFYNGAIPENCDVHHIDFDKENNCLENLTLLTKEEHKKIHMEHKSKISRKIESKSKFICLNCGREYAAVDRGNNRYCSRKCQKEYDRKNHLETRQCIICGKNFMTDARSDSKFCSHECIGKFLNKQIEKICPVCNKVFSDSVNGTQIFCSPQCAADSLKRREIKKCLHCGKEFSARINGKQKFCSEDCFYKFRQKREEKICPICGKKFNAPPSRNKKYCSRKCYFESRN